MKKILYIIFLLSGFAASAQVPLAGYITTIGGNYPTHLDSLGMGGYMTTYNKATRNAIPSLRRKIGMMVRYSSADSTFVLSGGISNSNWVAFTTAVDISGKANLTGGNTFTGDQIFSGNIQTESITDQLGISTGGDIVAAGNFISSQNINAIGDFQGNNFTASGKITTADTVFAATVKTTGNAIIGGALNISNNIAAEGDITTATDFHADGGITGNDITALGHLKGSDLDVAQANIHGPTASAPRFELRDDDLSVYAGILPGSIYWSGIGSFGTITSIIPRFNDGIYDQKVYLPVRTAVEGNNDLNLASRVNNIEADAQGNINLDLSGYALLSGGNTYEGDQVINDPSLNITTTLNGNSLKILDNSTSAYSSLNKSKLYFEYSDDAFNSYGIGLSPPILSSVGSGDFFTYNPRIPATDSVIVSSINGQYADLYGNIDLNIQSPTNYNLVIGVNADPATGILAGMDNFTDFFIADNPSIAINSWQRVGDKLYINITGFSYLTAGAFDGDTEITYFNDLWGQIKASDQYAFRGTPITEIDLPGMISVGGNLLDGCNLLDVVYFPSAKFYNGDTFLGCTNLTFLTSLYRSLDITDIEVANSISANILANDASGWFLTGNSGTVDGTNNIIGTLDGVPLNFRVNNQKAGRIEDTTTGANAFYGYQAGNSNVFSTTGAQNTAIGYQSFFTNISAGSQNSAVGFRSLYSNTATGNTAMGHSGLYFNSTGTYNSSLGGSALMSNTTGGSNTGIGYQSLFTNTTGSNNTGLGYLANVSSAALSNATAIGANSIVTASNTIQLGDSGVTTVNVGTTTSAKLVTGALQVKGGTINSGYVLTSDALGNASWQTDHLDNIVPLNFPSTLAGTSSTLTITVTGAVVGDLVVLGTDVVSENANSCYTAYVSATNTVTVKFNNYSLFSIDPALGSFKVRIWK